MPWGKRNVRCIAEETALVDYHSWKKDWGEDFIMKSPSFRFVRTYQKAHQREDKPGPCPPLKLSPTTKEIGIRLTMISPTRHIVILARDVEDRSLDRDIDGIVLVRSYILHISKLAKQSLVTLQGNVSSMNKMSK